MNTHTQRERERERLLAKGIRVLHDLLNSERPFSCAVNVRHPVNGIRVNLVTVRTDGRTHTYTHTHTHTHARTHTHTHIVFIVQFCDAMAGHVMCCNVMHYNTLRGYFYTTSSDICSCITSCFIVLYLISSSHLIKLILEDMRERARRAKADGAEAQEVRKSKEKKEEKVNERQKEKVR